MLSNPAQHATDCAPGHEWTGPFSNAYGFSDSAPSSDGGSPSTDCPTHEKDKDWKWGGGPKDVAFMLTGGKWNNGGGSDGCEHHHDGGCRAETDFQYGSFGSDAQVLQIGRHDCGGCDAHTAYKPGDGQQPMLLEVGDCGGGCPTAFALDSGDSDGALILVGHCGGGCPVGFGPGRVDPDGLVIAVGCGGGCTTPGAFDPGISSLGGMLLQVGRNYNCDQPAAFDPPASAAMPEYLI